VSNPAPITRAWRLEKSRKRLGSNNPRCFYCGETDVACLELDHPVTEDLDPYFTQIVCRNDHRKRELQRDVAGLTKNGRRGQKESKRLQLRRYLLLMAEHFDSMAAVSPDNIAAELRAAASSLRRKAAEL
jgi:hypothetical protein